MQNTEPTKEGREARGRQIAKTKEVSRTIFDRGGFNVWDRDKDILDSFVPFEDYIYQVSLNNQTII